jgi:hypothetical protein
VNESRSLTNQAQRNGLLRTDFARQCQRLMPARLAARERQALVQRSMRFKVLTCALVNVAQNV